jgi:hypothetical protein
MSHTDDKHTRRMDQLLAENKELNGEVLILKQNLKETNKQ